MGKTDKDVPTLKELQKLGEEMQTKVKFDPPIDYESDNAEELRDDIVRNAEAPKGEGLVEGDKDKFSPAAQATLEKLGAAPWGKDDEDEDKPEKEKDEEEEDDKDNEAESDGGAKKDRGDEEDGGEKKDEDGEDNDGDDNSKKAGKPIGKSDADGSAHDRNVGVGGKEKDQSKKKRKEHTVKKNTKEKKEKIFQDFSKSNKAIIYTLWKKGKGETDFKKLAKAVKNEIKENTIKNWLSAWNRGSNLPAIATK